MLRGLLIEPVSIDLGTMIFPTKPIAYRKVARKIK
jgi:hypothetical protein